MKKYFVVLLIFISDLIFLKGGNIEGRNFKGDEIYQTSAKLKHGFVELKLKKGLVINSSSVDEKDPPLFSAARKSPEKNLILLLSKKPNLKIYRFNNKGSLINSFLSKGEGPGELRSVYNLQILDNIIIAKDYKKIITYNINGKLKKENKSKIASFFSYFVDENRFIVNKIEWDKLGKPIRHLALISTNQEKIITSFCRDEKRRDIGVTMVLNSRMYHDWMTPDYKFAFLPNRNCLVCGLSDSNLLYLKDLKGKTIKTVKINFKKRTVTQEARNRFIESFKSVKKIPSLYKGLIKKIPNEFLTIMYIKLLPKDHFAVLLGIGYEKYTVKIFDKDLNYLYDIKFPENIVSRIGDLGKISFYEKGFFVIEDTEDENQYVEYQIKNLKQIFE